MAKDITWLGHASFKVRVKELLIYIDPYNISSQPLADIILITHQHYDHCSLEDVSKIKKPDTAIVAPGDCASTLGDINPASPGKELEIKGVKIEVTPAYNLNKQFHQKSKGWVGYIIDTPDGRIYHAGDTDNIPEMDNIKADIVLLPVGGTYTMDAKEAHQSALKIRPRLAIPMHYGEVAGSLRDAREFKSLCEKDGIEVEVLAKE